MISILFVCMGNICRSPLAEGAFRALVDSQNLADKFHLDSAGTIGYHAGSPPDKRSIAAAKAKEIDITNQRSRRVSDEDFINFDLIIVMDRDNERDLLGRCPDDHKDKIQLFLPFISRSPLKEMPDPYYGRDEDFDKCLDIAQQASIGLLEALKPHL